MWANHQVCSIKSNHLFFIDTFKDVYFMCIFTSLNLVSHYFKNCTSFKLVCKGHNDVALVDAFEATLLVVNFLLMLLKQHY